MIAIQVEIQLLKLMVVLELMHQLLQQLDLIVKDLHKEDPEVLLRWNLVMILDIKQVMMPGLMIVSQIETRLNKKTVKQVFLLLLSLALMLESIAKDLLRRKLIALLNKDKHQIPGLMIVSLIEIQLFRQMAKLVLMLHL